MILTGSQLGPKNILRHATLIPARAAPETPNPTIYLYLAPSLRFLTLRFLNILADMPTAISYPAPRYPID